MMSRVRVLLFVLLFGAVALFHAEKCPAQNLREFYPIADSFCRYPTFEDSLVVLCKEKLNNYYVTFVGIEGHQQVLLVAITSNPIKNIKKDIVLTVQFPNNGIAPGAGDVSTWGYVYDRNADGKVDYMALLGGAGAVWKNDVPENFPMGPLPNDMDILEIFVSHCQLVFNHWADDNYDGKLDGVVQNDGDPDREWIRRRLLVRSTKFNDKYDDITAFHETFGDLPGDSIEVTNSGVSYLPIGEKPSKIGKQLFEEKTNILSLINKAVEKCGVSRKLRGVPEDEE